MDLVDLNRLCWILMYQKDVMAVTMVFSMSLGWICLFKTFVDKVAGIITIYTEVICLMSPLFDISQFL